MNNITIHGRLTRKPELREYNNSKGGVNTLCRFSVAVNRRFGDETDFFDCTCFGKSGESIEKWFNKGDGIVLSGEMQSSKGRREDTKNVTYWNIIVQNWDFAEKSGAASSGSAPAPDRGPQTFEEMEEDIPF